MGEIHIDLFSTLDGVAQAPGGPDEDRESGFEFGGWQAPLFDDAAGARVGQGIARTDALLLGRKTYDIFAGYWPHQDDGIDGSIAQRFNSIPKYVASRGTPALPWAHSTQLGPDLASEVAALRARHDQVHVIGSVDLVQTLFAEGLFDRLNLWVHPLVLGTGKIVFGPGAVPTKLRLAEPVFTSAKGAVFLSYAREDGRPTTGDMSQPDRGQ